LLLASIQTPRKNLDERVLEATERGIIRDLPFYFPSYGFLSTCRGGPFEIYIWAVWEGWVLIMKFFRKKTGQLCVVD
jgi:hypothetical protein